MEDLAVAAELRVVSKIVNDNHYTEEFLVVLLLLVFYHLVLRVNNSLQAFRVIMVEEYRLLFRMLHPHLLLDIVLYRLPGHIHVDGRAEDVDATAAVPVDIQDHVLE